MELKTTFYTSKKYIVKLVALNALSFREKAGKKGVRHKEGEDYRTPLYTQGNSKQK